MTALDTLLFGSLWLAGYPLAEVDIRLFTTLVQFDLVYVGLSNATGAASSTSWACGVSFGICTRTRASPRR